MVSITEKLHRSQGVLWHTFAIMKPPKFHSDTRPDWKRTCRLFLPGRGRLVLPGPEQRATGSMCCPWRIAVTATTLSEIHRGNPLEVVEHMATSQLWAFERASDDELNVVVHGKWANYQVLFTWMYDIEALHLACVFELEAPEISNSESQQLIPRIN